MTGKEYSELAMRTNDKRCTIRLQQSFLMPVNIGEMLNACLGLSGEVGELNDAIKKVIFHGHDIGLESIKKELGDICWYIALMCEAFGFDLDKILQKNIDKLKARYPEGFSEAASKNRKEYAKGEGE